MRKKAYFFYSRARKQFAQACLRVSDAVSDARFDHAPVPRYLHVQRKRPASVASCPPPLCACFFQPLHAALKTRTRGVCRGQATKTFEGRCRALKRRGSFLRFIRIARSAECFRAADASRRRETRINRVAFLASANMRFLTSGSLLLIAALSPLPAPSRGTGTWILPRFNAPAISSATAAAEPCSGSSSSSAAARTCIMAEGRPSGVGGTDVQRRDPGRHEQAGDDGGYASSSTLQCWGRGAACYVSLRGVASRYFRYFRALRGTRRSWSALLGGVHARGVLDGGSGGSSRDGRRGRACCLGLRGGDSSTPPLPAHPLALSLSLPPLLANVSI